MDTAQLVALDKRHLWHPFTPQVYRLRLCQSKKSFPSKPPRRVQICLHVARAHTAHRALHAGMWLYVDLLS